MTATSAHNLNAHAVDKPRHGKPTDKYTGMTGAQIFHQMMAEHGVDTMFGYPGGAILLFDPDAGGLSAGLWSAHR